MSADLGLDRSGNSNNWAVNNMAFSDQVIDTPTNNFATFNTLAIRSVNTPDVTWSEGNLKAHLPIYGETYGNFFASTGKWYFELLIHNLAYGLTILLSPSHDGTRGIWTPSIGYSNNGNKNIATTYSAYGATYTTGDIISVAVDFDGDNVIFYKNGSTQGTISGSLTAGLAYGLMLSEERSGTHILNSGQDSSFGGNKTAQGNQDGNSIGDFYYAPPANHLAMCTSNLSAPAVKPKEHYDSPLYTGTGGGKTISGLDFQPDLVISGCLTANQNHHVHDAVRGVEKRLSTVNEESEYTDGALKTFTSDGYTFDTAGTYNTSGEDYVNWAWKANGSGSSNTNGTINTTATSANTAAGFSIVSWTGNDTNGATLGHGLTKAPQIIACKRRTSGDIAWYVYSEAVGNTKYVKWNETAAEATSAIWNNTSPTATVFSVSDGEGINSSSHTYIAYCWHSVDGYSKMGSYTGNGNNNGTFIYTGFRPAFIWIKSNTSAADNPIFTSAVTPTNIVDKMLFMNKYDDLHTSSGNAEIDIMSNGFKHRYQGGWTNYGDRGFIYMAFAETPFKYANAR